jgi:dolichyl-phosphate-mannose-protein mannosyltransferase
VSNTLSSASRDLAPDPFVVAAAPATLRAARRGLARVMVDAPLGIVLTAMVALGVALRAHHLGIPDTLKWDETHYVETARSYLAHQYAWNDHPPLGKLIIALSMKLLGDTPFAWRLPCLLFGVANIGLIGWLAHVVFQSRRAAVIAAAFVAVDGFFIAYSRAALLDGMIVAMGVGAVTLVLSGRKLWHVLVAGALAGGATSCKLNGLVFVAVALGVCIATRPLRRFALVLPISALAVFYAQCAYGLHLTGRSGSIAAVIAENRAMVLHHLSYTVVHPASSRWYTWFLPLRPIFLRHDVDVDGSMRVLLTLGHPLLWWASSAAVVMAAGGLFRMGPRQLLREVLSNSNEGSSNNESSNGSPRAIFWVLVAWAGPVVFWMPSLRDSYVYHYFPAYAFALVLLSGLAARLYERRRLLTLIGIVIVAEVAVFYSPVCGELPIAPEPLNARLFIPAWR